MWYEEKRGLDLAGCIAEFLFILASLFFIGFLLSFLAALQPNFQPDFKITPPQTLQAWLLLAVSCFAAASFEEYIFRKYIPEKLMRGMNETRAIAVSALLFSFFHRWEGFWGVYTALISAVFLSWRYKRHKRLLILVLAHAAYNFLVYLLSAPAL